MSRGLRLGAKRVFRPSQEEHLVSVRVPVSLAPPPALVPAPGFATPLPVEDGAILKASAFPPPAKDVVPAHPFKYRCWHRQSLMACRRPCCASAGGSHDERAGVDSSALWRGMRALLRPCSMRQQRRKKDGDEINEASVFEALGLKMGNGWFKVFGQCLVRVTITLGFQIFTSRH